MLEAHRVSSFRPRWEVREDGAPLLVLDKKGWRSGVEYTLDGTAYEVRSTWTGSRYTLAQGDAELAHTERIGRKHWSVTTPDGEYHFRRRSIWKSDQEWVPDPEASTALGGIRRTGTWRGDAEARLPGMPTPLAVFVLAVVLLMWEQAAAAATAAAATS
ncbi:MAG TPA: hypothetical protein VGH76_16675 [Actinomycetospora sp.]|jgi:hypothetical protein|uniref:hypothetical protein n=1 Tax=Actinomycetospora sp. TaxID=1872135 RepID=UPI002F3FCF0E